MDFLLNLKSVYENQSHNILFFSLQTLFNSITEYMKILLASQGLFPLIQLIHHSGVNLKLKP